MSVVRRPAWPRGSLYVRLAARLTPCPLGREAHSMSSAKMPWPMSRSESSEAHSMSLAKMPWPMELMYKVFSYHAVGAHELVTMSSVSSVHVSPSSVDFHR